MAATVQFDEERIELPWSAHDTYFTVLEKQVNGNFTVTCKLCPLNKKLSVSKSSASNLKLHIEEPLQFNRPLLVLCVLVAVSAQLLLFSNGCNEAICSPIVSKCMLTQSCKCDAKNTSCNKVCYDCLDYLYAKCCSCVEMCPKPNYAENLLSQKSHVEDLAEVRPDLFNALTEEKDLLLRWTTYTYPVTFSFISSDKDVVVTATIDNTAVESVPVNCTVAFTSQCMSWNECKGSCRSMGASSYRWFHDGCCECVGATCVNYGINESRCLECPPDKENMTVEEQEVLDKDTDKTEADISNFMEEEDEVD